MWYFFISLGLFWALLAQAGRIMAALGVRSIPPNPRVSVLEAADLAKRLDAEAVGAVMESQSQSPG